MRRNFLAVMAAFFLLTFYSCQPYGKKVKINDHLEVYVQKEATKEEGKKLGEYIATLDSSNTNQKSIQLIKEANTYTVKMVVPDEAANDPSLETSFQALHFLIKENVFPGQKLKLVLTDEKFNDKREVEELVDFNMEETHQEVMPADTTGL